MASCKSRRSVLALKRQYLDICDFFKEMNLRRLHNRRETTLTSTPQEGSLGSVCARTSTDSGDARPTLFYKWTQHLRGNTLFKEIIRLARPRPDYVLAGDTSSAALLPIEVQGLSWHTEHSDTARVTSASKQWKEPSLGNLWIEHTM